LRTSLAQLWLLDLVYNLRFYKLLLADSLLAEGR